MATGSVLVGRRDERSRLEEALQQARLGCGSLVLVAGDAGVGKSRLVDHVSGESGARVLWGRARHGAATPYGPVVSALRSLLRADAQALDGCGPLRDHLALILPELGEPAAESDRPTLFEAVRDAMGHLAREETAVVVLDDLQWSDEATLELLPALAESVSGLQLLILATYRSDGLPRDHPLRRVRHELRRSGRLAEVTVPPLSPLETAELLTHLLEQLRLRRSFARSTTGPRASRSLSRSSRRRCRSPMLSWRADAGWSSPATGRCPSPTPSAMPC